MHEMLANQYFISRNYIAAAKEIEKALETNPGSKSLRKKLIICYIQLQKINEALFLFIDLITEDIFCILNTDIEKDYCPCPKLIYQHEYDIIKSSPQNKKLILGMLWLYCDINKSTIYFSLQNEEYPRNEVVPKILTKLNQTLIGEEKWKKKKLPEVNF